MTKDAEERSPLDLAQDAINRMKRAHDRGTGCYLTAEMIWGLGISSIGQLWSEEDPRERDCSLTPHASN